MSHFDDHLGQRGPCPRSRKKGSCRLTAIPKLPFSTCSGRLVPCVHKPDYLRPCYSVSQRFQACVQAAAVLVYIFCGIFSSSFIVNFVVIVLLLTLDFWTVSSAVVSLCSPMGPCLQLHLVLQTKNVSGRLLVGLRWWNETTDEGSNWRFETLEEVTCVSAILSVEQNCTARKSPYTDHTRIQAVVWHLQGQRGVNKKDSACFWWSLYIMVRNASVICLHVLHNLRHARTTHLVCSWYDLRLSCGMQPVAWLALGIIALVKVSVGKHLCMSLAAGVL